MPYVREVAEERRAEGILEPFLAKAATHRDGPEHRLSRPSDATCHLFEREKHNHPSPAFTGTARRGIGAWLSARSADGREGHQVMRAAGDSCDCRQAAWRDSRAVAYRVADQRALALAESDLDAQRGAVLVRAGERGHRREVGMDPLGLG